MTDLQHCNGEISDELFRDLEDKYGEIYPSHNRNLMPPWSREEEGWVRNLFALRGNRGIRLAIAQRDPLWLFNAIAHLMLRLDIQLEFLYFEDPYSDGMLLSHKGIRALLQQPSLYNVWLSESTVSEIFTLRWISRDVHEFYPITVSVPALQFHWRHLHIIAEPPANACYWIPGMAHQIQGLQTLDANFTEFIPILLRTMPCLTALQLSENTR